MDKIWQYGENIQMNKILIVGSGSIGNRHLSIAKKLFQSSDIRVLSRKPNIEFQKSLSANYLSPNQLDTFKPEISIIANPSSHHVEIATKLALLGSHLLIEKPVSNSVLGLNELQKISLQNKIKIMVGYNLRFLNSLQLFRELVNSGKKIGKIMSIRCEAGQFLPSWRPEKDYRHSVSANEKLGGGVLLELSHEIDYIQWIFGKIKWVNAHLSKQSSLEIDVEDTAHLIVGFEKSDNNFELIGNLSLDFIRHDHTRKCLAIGEGGSLSWDGVQNKITFLKAGNSKWENIDFETTTGDDTIEAEWLHFLNCIENDSNPLVGLQEGISVLKVISAARQSSRLKITSNVE